MPSYGISRSSARPVVTWTPRPPRGSVPNFLPGKNPLPGLDPDLADKFTTPYEAKLGGPETMYPEFIKKMKTFKVPTKKATEADLGQ